MGLIHEGLIYASDEELSGVLVPFVQEALAAGQPALIALEPERRGVLRAALGDAEAGITYLDPREWYSRPGVALLAWAHAIDEARAAGAEVVRVVGEPPLAGDVGREQRWGRYEWLFNQLFADAPLWVMCPYDARKVSEAGIDVCRRTHPTIATTAAGRVPSPDYFARGYPTAVFVSAAEIDGVETSSAEARGTNELDVLRRAVIWPSRRTHLSVADAEDLTLAVDELARAAFASSAETVRVRTLQTDADWSCEVALTGTTASSLGAGRARFALAVGSIVSDRVELADDTGGGRVRFVFTTPTPGPRERILAAASELFGRDGIRATTVNAIAARASVAKATFYGIFPSKDALVLTWVQGIIGDWIDTFRSEVEARAHSPRERLYAWFEVLVEWVEQDVAAGSPLHRAANETRDSRHPASGEYTAAADRVRGYLAETAGAAGATDAEALAWELQLLLQAAIADAARSQSPKAAHVAASAAARLLETALPPAS